MKLRSFFLFSFLLIIHFSEAQVKGIRYIGAGYNIGYSRMGGMNRFIRAYNSIPNKTGGYTVTDSLDKMHIPKGFCVSMGLDLDEDIIFEMRYSIKKYFSEAGGPGLATDPGPWHRDIKVKMPSFGFGLTVINKRSGNVDFGYGGFVDISGGNMKTRVTTDSPDYKKIQGFFNIGATPFLQYFIYPFGRSSRLMIGVKPYYQMNLFRNNFEQINVEAPNYFGTKALKARGSNLGIEAQILIDLRKKEKKARIQKEPVVIAPEEEVKPIPPAVSYSLSGKSYDAATGNGISTEIEVSSADGTKKYTTGAGQDGSYSIELPESGAYQITVKAKGYITLHENAQVDGRLSKDLKLEAIAVGQSVKINNLLFEKGTAHMKTESYTELDHLAQFLNDNPTVEIELGGHTSKEDNQNSKIEEANMILAKDRVQTVKDYLVQKGVDGNRIKLKAYGSKKPVVPNDTEEHKALNRRVEYTIIKK